MSSTPQTEQDEHVGENLDVRTAGHPPRTGSPEYLKSRQWLMGVVAGGCYICGGPANLEHPDAPASSAGMQDHHGGGILVNSVLVGFNLFPLEWSMGWGADPARVQAFVQQLVDAKLIEWNEPAIATTTDVMGWVDSVFNANVKLCAPHHIGLETEHSPDHNGHEAVGIHNGPWPILAAQATWDWSKGDMWGGTTGTIAVAPHPTQPGASVVMHVSPAHPGSLQVGQVLPPTHPHSRAVHTPVA